MDQTAAVRHLRNDCFFNPDDDATLLAEWAAARNRVGAPIANAGMPDIQPIPASHETYVQQLAALPWVATHLATYGPTVSWAMVEIQPLLAYQITVIERRSQHHCGAFSKPPTDDELFQCCLPQAQSQEPVRVLANAQSMMVTARSLNVRMTQYGLLAPSAVGIVFGVALPLMHVVRYNGRYLLHNGFHRAHGLSQAGATHAPVLMRDAVTAADAGIRTDGATFSEGLLYSSDPPTMAHFSQERAHAVQLRPHTRAIVVTWADYALPENDD